MVVSNCCNAPVKVGGEGMTHWHVCTACQEACDVHDYRKRYNLAPRGGGRRVYAIDHREPVILSQGGNLT